MPLLVECGGRGVPQQRHDGGLAVAAWIAAFGSQLGPAVAIGVGRPDF
jgi:hypothetical protein